MNLGNLRTTMLSLNEIKKDFLNTELESVIGLSLAKMSDYATLVHSKCDAYAIDKTEEFIAYENQVKEILSTIVDADENGNLIVEHGSYRVDTSKVNQEDIANVNRLLDELYVNNRKLVDSHMMNTKVMYKFANEFEILQEDLNYIFSQDVSSYEYSIPREVLDKYRDEIEGVEINEETTTDSDSKEEFKMHSVK